MRAPTVAREPGLTWYNWPDDGAGPRVSLHIQDDTDAAYEAFWCARHEADPNPWVARSFLRNWEHRYPTRPLAVKAIRLLAIQHAHQETP